MKATSESPLSSRSRDSSSATRARASEAVAGGLGRRRKRGAGQRFESDGSGPRHCKSNLFRRNGRARAEMTRNGCHSTDGNSFQQRPTDPALKLHGDIYRKNIPLWSIGPYLCKTFSHAS